MPQLSNDEFWRQVYAIVNGSFPPAPPFNAALAAEIAASTPSGAANLVYATPNGSSGTASLRALVAADLPPTPPVTVSLANTFLLMGA